MKYVRNTENIGYPNDISPSMDNVFVDGLFKFELGRLNVTFLYKLIVQLEVSQIYIQNALDAFDMWFCNNQKLSTKFFQRFISNLDAHSLLENLSKKVNEIVCTIRQNLKPTNKINLAVNICGPVVLIPQKSSSPNVIAIDTGIFSGR